MFTCFLETNIQQKGFGQNLVIFSKYGTFRYTLHFGCALPPSVHVVSNSCNKPHLGWSGKRQKHEKAKIDPITTLFDMAMGLVAWIVEVEDIRSSLYLSACVKCVVRADMDLLHTCSAARTSDVLKKGGRVDFLAAGSRGYGMQQE